MHGATTAHHNGHPSSLLSSSSSSSSSSRLLCDGGDAGMVMYMDGFRWTLLGTGDDGCINLLFPSWKLDTVPRFLLAMAAVFATGVAAEGIRRWRRELSSSRRRIDDDDDAVVVVGRRRFRALQQVCLQGLGLLSAYLLMLVVMTYSYELLGCVVGGLMAGYYLFDNEVLRYGGGTPCCGSLLDAEPAAELAEPLLPRTAVDDDYEEDGVAVAERSCCHVDDDDDDRGAGGPLDRENGI